MKPTFALDLTRDSIGLLHRTPKGWLPLGDVAFDAPDLAEALDYLRKTALGLSPMGVATKIVLPSSQVLYTEVHAPGPTRDDKRKQIMAALEGRTPYDVSDLVFDWSGKGATVKVAVVARETLAEAEAFASEHRLNPVSFVAIPEGGVFVGEPWFGPTDAATSILAPGEAVDRDRDVIVILQRDLPIAEKPGDISVPDAPDLSAEEKALSPETVISVDPEPDDTDDPLPGLEEALSADITPPVPSSTPAFVPFDADDDEDADDMPSPAVADVVVPVPPVVQPAAAVAEEVEEAPFAHVTDSAAFPEPASDLSYPAKTASAAPADLEDDLPPAPPSAAMVAFASRRAAPATAGAGVADSASASGTPARAYGKPVEDLPAIPRPTVAAARPQPAVMARPVPAKTFAGLVTAPSIPGTRKVKSKNPAPSDVPRPPGIAAAGSKTLIKPGGTFGNRAPQRGRPRFLGLILTALLLVCLALMAAWASFFLSQTDLSAPEPAVAVADAGAVPGIDDEMLADMQDPEGMTDPLPEAAGTGLPQADTLATQSATDALPDVTPAAEEPVVAPDVVAEAVPEPAPQTEVTTDLVAAQAPAEDQDEIFLSAMDAPPPALDALALPVPEAIAEVPPDPPVPPPPFGTVYQFDAAGFLKPTADGILSPDGVFLVAGKPPLLPPTRSEIAVAAAEAASAFVPPVAGPVAAAGDAALATTVPPGDAAAAGPALTPPAPSDPALAGFRPRARPDGLTQATDDGAALATGTATDFAAVRPLARPATILAAAASLRPADDLGAQGASLTAQRDAALAAAAADAASNPSIVVISRRPAARPRDLSRAVEAAVAAAVREPEPEKVAAAAAASALNPEVLDELDEPETARVAPKIPTRANVAKQATFANAINLSKTNLIGVYGSQSRRYALIRQSNGRYKKVRVGDKIEGGTIQAITENEVRYQKGGKLIALRMPQA